MKIDSTQLRQLREALLSAFPTRQDLEEMVFDQLNENLSAITTNGTLVHTIFELVRWAMAQGRLEELVIGAVRQNNQNPQLRRVAQSLSLSNDDNIVTNSSATTSIADETSNRQAQGVFKGPVSFGNDSSAIRPGDRNTMLERVRIIWIKGVLEQSLHKEVCIALDLHQQPDLIENPWGLTVQETNQPARSLSSDTSITQVYDEAGGQLLILGEPGSGKTTLLLQLAHELLGRASRDEKHPIPVVFNLSSWGGKKRQPLAEWLIEELKTKYHVPQEVGKLWVDDGQVLPLLDGLDEVAKEYRATCVDTINAYRQEQGLSPLVVCSRTIEYRSQKTKVSVQSAVMIQLLTVEQIYDYLAKLESAEGERLKDLRRVMHDDPAFQELANTPLMLSILVLTYNKKSLKDIVSSGSVAERKYQIFTDYVERMLGRRSLETRYTSAETKHWLIWLAKQMRQHEQSQFYLERLQSDWLSNNWLYQYYTSLSIGLLSFLVMLPADVVLFQNILFGFLVAFLDAILALPFVWLMGRGTLRNTFFFTRKKGFPFFALNKEALHSNEEGKRNKERSGLTTFFVLFLRSTLFFAGLNGFLDGILVQCLNSFYTWDHGLFYATFYMVLGALEQHIQPAEKLNWSWASAWRSAASSLFLGGIVGFILGISNAVNYLSDPITSLTTLAFGLILGIAIGWVIMLMRGFSSSMLDDAMLDEKEIKPNRGIRNSLSNSIRLGMSSGLAFGLVIFLFYFLGFHFKVGYLGVDQRFPQHSDLIYGVSDGLTVAYLYWLKNGGFAWIQHLMLRVCLWQAKHIPWRFLRFLDYAHERILLRKIGGGYTFIHKLLLEYFADLDNASP